jgi:hypothetical protein
MKRLAMKRRTNQRMSRRPRVRTQSTTRAGLRRPDADAGAPLSSLGTLSPLAVTVPPS